MKKKVYLILLLSFFLFVLISIVIINNTITNIKTTFAQKYYHETIQRYKTFVNGEATFLKSIAKYLATSKITLKSYLTNNKKYIITSFMPLYKTLYNNNLIYEMHFFKTPVKNFIAFNNLNLQEINLTKARRDVLWVTTSLKPAVYFYICRNYPGLRATYPIIYNYKILGSVSIGNKLIYFKKLFDKIDMPTTLFLNNDMLKNSLQAKKFTLYKKYPLYKGYRVIGSLYKVNFNNKYEIKKNFVYIIIPIKNLFKKTIGYLVIKHSFADVLKAAKNNIISNLIFDTILFIGIFGLFFILFKYIYNRFNELNLILNLIKNKKFNKLPEKVEEKDEFDEFKNYLIDVGNELSLYINILTNKMEYYSQKAYIDELTSIQNRNFLEEKAKEITLKTKLTKDPLGIILFDLDNFKQINDTYGHDIGDLVLREVAQTIKKHLRKEDFFIRYGGEEFLILLHNTHFKNTIKIAEKIRKSVENLKIQTPKKILNVTISVGVSEFLAKDNDIFDAIKRADKKLYEAKTNGKNKIIY